MEISAHRVNNIRVKETIHDTFVVKDISLFDGNGNELKIKLFGENRTALNFIYEDILDARENELC